MTTLSRKIDMVNLFDQYQNIKHEIDAAIQEVLDSSQFIKGPKVATFEKHLAEYLDVKHVISCGNGTDAILIALMSLDLEPGDEVIVPAFTYAATAECIALLGLTPVMIDVDLNTFNIEAETVEKAITSKTKAVIPVHLFGQSTDMEAILVLCESRNIAVIEDNAQAIGADYFFKGNKIKKTGTLGDFGCTSFFPSKNLGCFGDGGAVMTNDDDLAKKARMVANHGQAEKYKHQIVGLNSRLDAIQAAVLNVKLKYLNDYTIERQKVAEKYDKAFNTIENISIPKRSSRSSHVFHQYTLQVKNGERDKLKKYLLDKEISSMIYYPIPLYKQEAYSSTWSGPSLKNTEKLCQSVLSLPIHTEMKTTEIDQIISAVEQFFKKPL